MDAVPLETLHTEALACFQTIKVNTENFQEDCDNKEANLGYGKAKAANNLAIEKLIQNTGVNIVVAKLEDDAAAPFTPEVLIGHTLWLLLHEHLDGLLKYVVFDGNVETDHDDIKETLYVVIKSHNGIVDDFVSDFKTFMIED
jgi:hypothetical protein